MQRTAVEHAAEIAGLKLLRLINEPTAAALAYGVDQGSSKGKTVAVYDFGGTLDISVLEMEEGVLEVKSTSGNSFLGGEDIDRLVVNFLVAKFKEKSGIELTKENPEHREPLQRLKEAAEQAKIELSSAGETDVTLPYLMVDSNKVAKHLKETITRSQFNGIIEDIVKDTFRSVEKALKGANLSVSDIDEVLLVGGSTRIPYVIEQLEKFFGKTPNRSLNPDEVVARGAAIQANVLVGGNVAGIGDMVLVDVTPADLGIETLGGAFTVMIPANSSIPVKKTQVFSTAADGQTEVHIKVLQGFGMRKRGERPWEGY